MRLAHEEGLMSVTAEVVSFNPRDHAAVAVTAIYEGGRSFTGYGYADKERDKMLAVAMLELAQSRALARALRFGGQGMEYTGAEEVSHIQEGDGSPVPSRPSPPTPSSVSGGPTDKQLALIRSLREQLALMTGQPVNPPSPKTAKAASEMIENMQAEVKRFDGGA